MRDPAAPRLGRGLAALLAQSPQVDADDGIMRVLPVAAIRPNPKQPRRLTDEESLQELVHSIAVRGVLQPVLVRQLEQDPVMEGRISNGPVPGQASFEIVAGERRWRAARLAGLHQIPTRVLKLSEEEAAAVTLVENLQRTDLNAIEEADGYSRIIADFGSTHDDIAKAVGKSRVHVTNIIRLLGLPGPVQMHVREGRLSAGHARALLKHADPEQAADLVIRRGLNVRQTEGLTLGERAVREPIADDRAGISVDINRVERDLADQLGLRATVAHGPRGGRLIIEYQTVQQLEAVLSLLLRRSVVPEEGD